MTQLAQSGSNERFPPTAADFHSIKGWAAVEPIADTRTDRIGVLAQFGRSC